MIVIIYAGINTATFDSHDTILGSVDVPDAYDPDIEDDIMTLSIAGREIKFDAAGLLAAADRVEHGLKRHGD